MKNPAPKLTGFWHELFKTLEKKHAKQVKSIKQMRKAVKRTSQLTHAIDEGIVVLKDDFSLNWWNATAKKLLGLRSSDRGHILTSLVREPELNTYLSQKKSLAKSKYHPE